MREDGRIKMSELARLSEVPASTIKHYIREGLVPDTAIRSSRNMAWYDAGLVHRIKAIKSLQRDRYLPLKVIKDTLEVEPQRQENAARTIAETLNALATTTMQSRTQLVGDGMDASELDWLIERGLIDPITGEDGEHHFRGDDVALIQVLAEGRKQGLSVEIMPIPVIEGYLTALRELVRFEWGMFSSGILAEPDADVQQLANVATRLSESLVMLLRRKLLIPTLKEFGLLAEDAQLKEES